VVLPVLVRPAAIQAAVKRLQKILSYQSPTTQPLKPQLLHHPTSLSQLRERQQSKRGIKGAELYAST
jgi:hypothetical protein